VIVQGAPISRWVSTTGTSGFLSVVDPQPVVAPITAAAIAAAR